MHMVGREALHTVLEIFEGHSHSLCLRGHFETMMTMGDEDDADVSC